jgi:hypothetical protein
VRRGSQVTPAMAARLLLADAAADDALGDLSVLLVE